MPDDPQQQLQPEVGRKLEKAFTFEADEFEWLSRRRSYAHRSACNVWNAINYVLGAPAALLAVAAGATALLTHHTILTGSLGLAGGLCAALATFLNSSQQGRLHQAGASNYAELQGDFRRLRDMDFLLGSDVHQLRKELEDLVTKFNSVDADSPPIPWWARRRWKLDPKPKHLPEPGQ